MLPYVEAELLHTARRQLNSTLTTQQIDTIPVNEYQSATVQFNHYQYSTGPQRIAPSEPIQCHPPNALPEEKFCLIASEISQRFGSVRGGGVHYGKHVKEQLDAVLQSTNQSHQEFQSFSAVDIRCKRPGASRLSTPTPDEDHGSGEEPGEADEQQHDADHFESQESLPEMTSRAPGHA